MRPPSCSLNDCFGDLETRNQEVQELRHLLDQQTETRDRQFAIGAAAIAEKIDSDELVRQERDRLRRLQTQWEEKFREEEIEASLERAKLSRQRQELAKRQAELEEELEHIRREQEPTGRIDARLVTSLARQARPQRSILAVASSLIPRFRGHKHHAPVLMLREFIQARRASE